MWVSLCECVVDTFIFGFFYYDLFLVSFLYLSYTSISIVGSLISVQMLARESNQAPYRISLCLSNVFNHDTYILNVWFENPFCFALLFLFYFVHLFNTAFRKNDGKNRRWNIYHLNYIPYIYILNTGEGKTR